VDSNPGLPDFYWYDIPKRGKSIYQITIGKIYQMSTKYNIAIKYTKWTYNRLSASSIA
jgi:hypothetical protein